MRNKLNHKPSWRFKRKHWTVMQMTIHDAWRWNERFDLRKIKMVELHYEREAIKELIKRNKQESEFLWYGLKITVVIALLLFVTTFYYAFTS